MTISDRPPPPPSQQQQQPSQNPSKPVTNRKRPYKPKVKTGCTSCRLRRVKCDEGKPSCQRCISTGRTCDGYEDLFRLVQWTPNQGPDPPPPESKASGSTSDPTAATAALLSTPTANTSTGTQKRKRQSTQQPQLQLQQQYQQPVQEPALVIASHPRSSRPAQGPNSSFRAAETNSRLPPTTTTSTPSSTAFSPSPPVSNASWPGSSAVPSPSHTTGWTLASRPAAPSSTGYHPSPVSTAVASSSPHHSPGTGVISPTATAPPLTHSSHGSVVPQQGRAYQPKTQAGPPAGGVADPVSSSTPPPVPSTVTPPRLTADDIATLAARFTNKPISEGYEVEARTTLEFSLSEPAVRHALTALQSLYKTLEDHGHEFPHGRLAVPTVFHGLQEYNNAIVNLANKLAVMDRRSCEVALVCCRLFISIGTITRDYTAVAEHYIRGMRIMHEAATRPYLDAWGNVIPTQNGDFPKIDVFMIKIFMSPDRMAPACKAAALAIKNRKRLPPREWMQLVRYARNEVRAARVKARLLVISKLALQHFDNVSRLRPGADSAKVRAEKEVLVTMLDDLDLDRKDGPRQLGEYHGRFHFLYHSALKIAVRISLKAPNDDLAELKPVFERVGAVSGCVI